jgi:putative membrane protein
LSLIALTCSLGLAFGAGAQTADIGTPGTTATNAATTLGDSAKADSLSAADRQFVEKAAMAGMAEVEFGRLAQQKATSIPVRVFGERIVQDYSEANDELRVIASATGTRVPAELEPRHLVTRQMLQNLSGAEFDREYMKQTVAHHQQTVSDFRKQAESGKDADLNGFVASILPMLEAHLKTARSLSEATKPSRR